MGTLKFTMAILMTGSWMMASAASAEEKVVKPMKVIGASESTESVYEIPNGGVSVTKPSFKNSAVVPPAEVYPEGAVSQAYQEELFEIKKSEEAERKAVKARDAYEARKVEAEKEISAKKYHIENLKMKQEQVSSEIDMMNTELADVEKRYKDSEAEYHLVEQKAAEHFVSADQLKKELEASKTAMESTLDKLRTLKEQSAQTVNKNATNIQRMRSEVAILEAEVESLEASRDAMMAEELKTRSEWMALKAHIEEKNADKSKYLAQLNDTKKKYDQALKDFRTAQTEYSVAEKSRAETEQRVNSEIRKLDDASAAAQRGRSMAMAEKIRVEAETEKLKAYVAAVKKSNNETQDSMKDAQNEVMQSRLALETAKSELTQEVATGEKAKFRQDKISSRLRSLASVAEQSDMMDGGKAWLITKACKIQKRPSSKSDSLGEVTVGQKLVGSESYGNWVKILNSSGGAAYVKGNCGEFQQ